MAGNWMDDDRERRMREREWRRSEDLRRGEAEARSWDSGERPEAYGARRDGPDRDRVFGEGETGVSYGGRSGSQAYRGPQPRTGWQSRNYGGVSPAMQRGEYGGRRLRFTRPDYSRPDYSRADYSAGGRFYGDDDQERIYREEYGQGGVEYGDVPRGYDAQRSETRERYHEAGYGRSGYGAYPGEFRDEMRGERFADAGRGAGDFLHRAGERVAAWFGAGAESRIHDPDFQGRARGARGLGPQGYRRSDDRISDDAHERLTDDTWLDASNISISVSGGEITLSGTVESREAKHRAERLVEDISGVGHVQNNLRTARGNPLTSAGSGYGDSVLGAQMRRDDPAANDPLSGGEGGGSSGGGRKN